MANLRIVPLNHWDAATLSTTGAMAAGFPLINTQNSTRGLVARSTSNAAQSWKATWGASPVRTCTFFGMFLHTVGGIGSTGTIRVQLYSDAAWTTGIYDSTALSANNITPTEAYQFGISSNDPFAGTWPFWLWFTSKTFRSAQITFGGTPLNAYFQASRIFIGEALEVTYNPAYGATLGWVDKSDRNRSRGGSLRTSVGPSWRVMDNPMPWVDNAQRASFLDTQRYCGTGRDFVISLYPEDGTRLERDYMLNAKFVALDALGRPSKNRLSTRLQVEEV